MALNSSSDNRLCAPLLNALELMQQWVSRDGASRLIVAMPTLGELKHQTLPTHVSPSIKKRRGPRVPIHGPRQYGNVGLFQAKWPADSQQSVVIPTLLCVISGQADFHIADYFLQCRAGDFLLFPPGVPLPTAARSHILDGDAQRHCALLWMAPKMANIDGMECWICHSQGQKHEIGRAQEVCWIRDPFIIDLFGKFVEDAQQFSGGVLTMHLLMSLLLLIQHEIEAEKIFLPGHHSNQLFEQPLPLADQDPIESACVYIDSHLNQPLTITQVAQRCCLSPASFTRKFRKHTGQTFKEYLTTHRLQAAASLLHDSNWSVNKIGEFVGLKPSQLRQLFHQHYNCSPLTFRQRKID